MLEVSLTVTNVKFGWNQEHSLENKDRKLALVN